MKTSLTPQATRLVSFKKRFAFGTAILAAALTLISSHSVQADPNATVDYAFSVNGTGNNLLWSLNTPNWSPTAPVGGPDAIGIYVTLTNNITSGRSIALFNTASPGNAGDAIKTVGRLDIGDPDGSHAFTITTGTAAGVLDFNGNGGTALLNQVSGSAADSISAPITLSTGLKIGNASTNNLTLSGAITGSNAIEINSSGTGGVILSNGATSTFSGGVTVTAGALLLGNSSTPTTGTVTGGPIGTGTLTLNGGTVTSSSTNRNIANAITLGGSVTVSDYAIDSNRTLTLNGAVSLTNSLTLTSAGVATFAGVVTPTTGSKTLTLSSAGTNTGTISGAILTPTTSGTLDIVKTGTGRWDLSDATAATNFTGGVTIKQGTLGITADLNTVAAKSSAGTGTITLGDGSGSVDATLALSVAAAKTITNAIVAATGSTGNTLAIQSDLTQDTTFTGGITMNHALTLKATNTGDIIISTGNVVANSFKITNASTNASGNTIINSIVSGSGASLEQNSIAGSVLTLANDNSYTGSTTITSGTLQIGNGGTTGSLATSSTITNNGTLIFNRSDTVTQGTQFSGSAITGTGSLTQTGAGTLVLNTANSYSGATIISGGTLQISAANNIGDGSATNTISIGGSGKLLSTSGTYDLGVNRTITMTGISALQADSGTLTISSNINNNANLLTVTGAGSIVMNGVMGNSTGGLTVTAGNLTLTNANTFTGVTNLTAGATLRLTNINALQSSNFKTNGSTLQLVSDTDATFNQSGVWVNSGNATIDVSGTVAGRTIGLAGAWNQAAGGSLTVSNSSNNGDILALGNATVTGAAGRITANGAVTTGAITTSLASGTTTLTLNGTNSGTVTGTISDGGTATIAVTKNESGKWTFSGNNTYTGTTTVSAGTLLVDGGQTAAGAYSVSLGATLGGTGSITTASNAGITFANGAALSPGDNSASNLTAVLGSGVFDISAMATTGKLLFTLGTSSDKLTLTSGTLSIGTLNSSEFAFALGGGFGAGTYTLFDTAATITSTSLDTATFALNGSFNGNLQFANSNQDIQLVVTAVPEPATWALLAFSMTTVMVLRRRNF